MASCESDLLVSLREGMDSHQAAVAIDSNRQRVARPPRDGEHVFLTASQILLVGTYASNRCGCGGDPVARSGGGLARTVYRGTTTHTANGLTVDWSARSKVFQSPALSTA